MQPVSHTQVSGLGILKRDSDGSLTNFVEKPKDPEILKKFVSRDDPQRPYLGSMGIYFFKTDVLMELLKTSSVDDFGKEVIPVASHTKKGVGFDYIAVIIDAFYFQGFFNQAGSGDIDLQWLAGDNGQP